MSSDSESRQLRGRDKTSIAKVSRDQISLVHQPPQNPGSRGSCFHPLTHLQGGNRAT